jgi:hypothetical protein
MLNEVSGKIIRYENSGKTQKCKKQLIHFDQIKHTPIDSGGLENTLCLKNKTSSNLVNLNLKKDRLN